MVDTQNMDEVRILRSLAGGRKALPLRDATLAGSLARDGLIEHVADNRSGAVWDLTVKGEDRLLEIDGPLTEDEREEWMKWPKTRFGRDGVPQKILQRGWKSFSAPRARALLERWRRYGIRQSW